MKKALFIPDCHIPYHDKHAFKLMLRAAKAWRPNIVVVLGDFGDMHCTNGHRKNPNRPVDLAVEVNACNDALDQIDALGADEKHFIQGNHEENVERYLMDKAPQLFNMVTIPGLFGLRRRGWKYTPYRKHVQIGKLYVTHDCGNAGPQAAAKARDTFHGNVVIGHTHRMGLHYSGNAKGQSHVGANFGWLGDVSQADYMHQVQSSQWQLGFGTGVFEPNGTVHLQGHPIVNGNVVVDGVKYSLPS